jgi:phosphomannomutase
MTHIFHPTMLREYDIRGVVGDTLSEKDAYAIGRSFATLVARAGGKRVAVGFDGRLSSPMLCDALVAGINAAGIDALNVGLGPTPMLYYAASTEEVDGGIQITGSHNPPDYNGFKFVMQGRPFYGADIQRIGEMAAAGDWEVGEGATQSVDIIDAYVDRLVEGFTGGAYRVGWDAGNGAAGTVIEKLTAKLPGEHHLLFTDIDGHFPNHHPDPTEEKNLADLRQLVAEKRLDFGVAFDGDGDRIGAIDGEGRVIWGDQLLQIYAAALLPDMPGATIIADVKASQALFDRVSELGGTPLMWKTGHSLIKAKMKETGSPLAGEMSGHVFFADRYYGYDDAPYAAVRLIEAATKLGQSVTELRGAMAPMVNTPELRFQIDEVRKFAIVEEVLARLTASGAQVDRTDGARVLTDDGWWLLRASNTQDVLVARAEANDEAALARLLAAIDEQLALSGIARGPQAGH